MLDLMFACQVAEQLVLSSVAVVVEHSLLELIAHTWTMNALIVVFVDDVAVIDG